MENPKQHDSSIFVFKLLVYPDDSNKNTPIAGQNVIKLMGTGRMPTSATRALTLAPKYLVPFLTFVFHYVIKAKMAVNLKYFEHFFVFS